MKIDSTRTALPSSAPAPGLAWCLCADADGEPVRLRGVHDSAPAARLRSLMSFSSVGAESRRSHYGETGAPNAREWMRSAHE